MQGLALPVLAALSCKVTSTWKMAKPPANPAPGACSLPESKPELLQVTCRVVLYGQIAQGVERNFSAFSLQLKFCLETSD